MSEKKRVLVLHLSGGGEPFMLEVTPGNADDLAARLPTLMSEARVESVIAANGVAVAIHFGHVLAAHIDTMQGMGVVFGSPPRER